MNHVGETSEREWVIGIDEVGRGPVAGPVTICVCACPRGLLEYKKRQHSSVGDSKKISPARRETLAALLRRDKEIIFRTASVSSSVIDKVGISKALRIAVARGLKSLDISVSEMEVRLDGRLYAPKEYTQSTIVRGDTTEWVIGAASIVAKVHRDAKMVSFDKRHPKYGFARHKGYGTKVHYAAIKKYGPCPIHRHSFLGRILNS